MRITDKNILKMMLFCETSDTETTVELGEYEEALFARFFPKLVGNQNKYNSFKALLSSLITRNYIEFHDHSLLEESYWVTKEGLLFLQNTILLTKEKIWNLAHTAIGTLIGAAITFLFTLLK